MQSTTVNGLPVYAFRGKVIRRWSINFDAPAVPITRTAGNESLVSFVREGSQTQIDNARLMAHILKNQPAFERAFNQDPPGGFSFRPIHMKGSATPARHYLDSLMKPGHNASHDYCAFIFAAVIISRLGPPELVLLQETDHISTFQAILGRQEIPPHLRPPLVVNAIDLSGLDLSQMDFSGIEFKYSLFEKADLRGSNLSTCRLFDCCFGDSDLREANLQNSQWINNTNPCGSRIDGAKFDGAYMEIAHRDFWVTGTGTGRFKVHAVRASQHVYSTLTPQGFDVVPERDFS